METVATVVIGDTSDPIVSTAVDSLATLGHRSVVSARRRYEFPDGTRAEAFGTKTEILAYTPTTLVEDVRASIETRRSVRVPTLSWSDSRVLDDTVVTDILITHRARFRVQSPRTREIEDDVATHRPVTALVYVGETFKDDARALVDASLGLTQWV